MASICTAAHAVLLKFCTSYLGIQMISITLSQTHARPWSGIPTHDAENDDKSRIAKREAAHASKYRAYNISEVGCWSNCRLQMHNEKVDAHLRPHHVALDAAAGVGGPHEVLIAICPQNDICLLQTQTDSSMCVGGREIVFATHRNPALADVGRTSCKRQPHYIGAARRFGCATSHKYRSSRTVQQDL